MEGAYRFDASPPGQRLDLAVSKTIAGEPAFTATLALERHPITDTRLLALFFTMPLITLKVVAAIHWEALRPFLKGVPLVRPPAGPDVGHSAGSLFSRPAGKNDATLSLTDKERR